MQTQEASGLCQATHMPSDTHGPEAKELQGKPLRQLLDFLGTKPPGLCSSPPGAAMQPFLSLGDVAVPLPQSRAALVGQSPHEAQVARPEPPPPSGAVGACSPRAATPCGPPAAKPQGRMSHRLLLKDHMLGTCPWVSGSCSGQPRGDLSAVTGITTMRSPLHLPQWLFLFCFLSFNTTRVHPDVAPGCWGGRCGSAVAALRNGDPLGTGTASFHASTALVTSCLTEAWDFCSASASAPADLLPREVRGGPWETSHLPAPFSFSAISVRVEE